MDRIPRRLHRSLSWSWWQMNQTNEMEWRSHMHVRVVVTTLSMPIEYQFMKFSFHICVIFAAAYWISHSYCGKRGVGAHVAWWSWFHESTFWNLRLKAGVALTHMLMMGVGAPLLIRKVPSSGWVESEIVPSVRLLTWMLKIKWNENERTKKKVRKNEIFLKDKVWDRKIYDINCETTAVHHTQKPLEVIWNDEKIMSCMTYRVERHEIMLGQCLHGWHILCRKNHRIQCTARWFTSFFICWIYINTEYTTVLSWCWYIPDRTAWSHVGSLFAWMTYQQPKESSNPMHREVAHSNV